MALMDKAGIQFAYWRLSPAHPWYGGAEICEKLAVNTGPGVQEALQDKGHDPASVNQRGLYLTSNYPHIPHPNCRCFQEPLFLRTYQLWPW